MKTHSVKSNAKRLARKLCERFLPSFEAVEPIAADDGTWFPAVRIVDDKGVVGVHENVGENAIVLRPDGSRLDPWHGEGVESRAGLIIADHVAADDTLEIPAFLRKGLTAVEVTAPDSGSDTASVTVTKGQSAGKTDAKRLADIARELPPFKPSTREEILARREERRARKAAQPKKETAAEKVAKVNALLDRPGGALTSEFVTATGWTCHSVRRFMSQAGIRGTREGKESRYARSAA